MLPDTRPIRPIENGPNLAAANEYLGQRVANEDGFSIATCERRAIVMLVVEVKASARWIRFDNESPLAEKAEAAL
jgi:hypothetical protein